MGKSCPFYKTRTLYEIDLRVRGIQPIQCMLPRINSRYKLCTRRFPHLGLFSFTLFVVLVIAFNFLFSNKDRQICFFHKNNITWPITSELMRMEETLYFSLESNTLITHKYLHNMLRRRFKGIKAEQADCLVAFKILYRQYSRAGRISGLIPSFLIENTVEQAWYPAIIWSLIRDNIAKQARRSVVLWSFPGDNRKERAGYPFVRRSSLRDNGAEQAGYPVIKRSFLIDNASEQAGYPVIIRSFLIDNAEEQGGYPVVTSQLPLVVRDYHRSALKSRRWKGQLRQFYCYPKKTKFWMASFAVDIVKQIKRSTNTNWICGVGGSDD